jgi:hypothetical protein
MTTRFEPEVFVPPLPGESVRKAARPAQSDLYDQPGLDPLLVVSAASGSCRAPVI